MQREFGIAWSAREQEAWQRLCGLLTSSALAQPVVAVHSDWMPRNLMLAAAGAASPGILDFQDAVAGPISYDLTSLLRDAFISWEEQQEIDWAVRYAPLKPLVRLMEPLSGAAVRAGYTF